METASTAGDSPRGRGRPARHEPGELVALVATEFLVRGYDATSMGDLARATGLTKPALYHHVAGKEEFLRLAIARGVDALDAAIAEAEVMPVPAVQRLERVLRESVRVLVEQLPYVTLLLRVHGNTETERWAVTRRRELDARVSALAAQAVRDGDLRSGTDARLLTRLLFGAVNSITEWYRPEADDHGLRAIADAVAALLPRTGDRR